MPSAKSDFTLRCVCVCVFPADDGKLSLDEFQAFFSDGTLNEEELEKLFHTIDSDNTRSAQPRRYCVVALAYSMYVCVLCAFHCDFCCSKTHVFHK